jgi:hypothetical protein
MSRGSSGSADDVCWTLVAVPCPFCPALAEGDGVTVGNRPPRLGGVMVELGKGWSVVGGSGGIGGKEPPAGEWWCLVTTVVTVASAGDSVPAWTLAVSVIGEPGVAVFSTWSVTLSSKA